MYANKNEKENTHTAIIPTIGNIVNILIHGLLGISYECIYFFFPVFLVLGFLRQGLYYSPGRTGT
jgi:hypothetical protein